MVVAPITSCIGVCDRTIVSSCLMLSGDCTKSVRAFGSNLTPSNVSFVTSADRIADAPDRIVDAPFGLCNEMPISLAQPVSTTESWPGAGIVATPEQPAASGGEPLPDELLPTVDGVPFVLVNIFATAVATDAIVSLF